MTNDEQERNEFIKDLPSPSSCNMGFCNSRFSKFLENNLNAFHRSIILSFGVTSFVLSLEGIIRYKAFNNIKNTIYSHVDKITPEIIEEVDFLTSKFNPYIFHPSESLYCGMGGLILGLYICSKYIRLLKESSKF